MTEVPTAAADDPDPPARRWRRVAGHACVWLLTIALVAAAAYGGLRLRRWTWDATSLIHFRSDITRGYGWGVVASGDEGYLNAYDKMARQGEHWRLWLDYAPLRLAVMTRWATHNRLTQADPLAWRPEYEFNRPILWFNAAMEGVGVVAAFFLVRKIVRDSDAGPPARGWPGEWIDRLRRRPAAAPISLRPRPFRGWPQGLAAALLLWFNPSMILSAHGWPTWDIWIVPMFLLALLAAAYGRWAWAGAAMGVGAMFKGQLFVGLPVFLAWTLLNGDWRGALRFVAGLGVALAAVASPWLVTMIPADVLAAYYARQQPPSGTLPQEYASLVAQRVWNPPAILFVAGVAAASITLPGLLRSPRPRTQYAAAAVAAAAALWPIAMRHDGVSVAMLTAGLGVWLGVAFFARRWPDRVLLTLASAAAALLAGMTLFDASSAWWQCGIAYGTDHFRYMVMGLTDNLPALLDRRFGWHSIDDVVFTTDWPTNVAVTMRMLTRGLMIAAMIPCLWAVARHARRRDRRLLVAVVAPWLAFFCLPTQIHERYLIYAAALGSIWAGESVGTALMAALLTAATFVQQLHVMLIACGRVGEVGAALHAWRPDWFDPTAGDTLLRNLAATFPDLAYANLMALLVVIYVAVCKTPTRQPWSAGRSVPDQAISHDDATAGDAQNASDGGNPSGRNAVEQR